LLLAVALIAFGALGGAIFKRTPGLAIYGFIATIVLFPGIARGSVTPFLHPSLFILIGLLIAQLGNKRAPRSQASITTRLLLSIATLISAYALIESFFGIQAVGWWVTTTLSYVLLPPLAYLVLREAQSRGQVTTRGISILIALLVLFESALGMLQTALGEPVVWEMLFSSQWWWQFPLTRAIGTMGHWIPYALFISAALPLLIYSRSKFLILSVVPVAMIAILLSQSRAGIILGVLGALFAVLGVIATTGFRRSLPTVLAIAIIAALAIPYLGSVEAISRFGAAGEASDLLRTTGLQWFIENSPTIAVYGDAGFTDPRGNGALTSSLENGFLMFAVNWGVVPAVALFVLHLCGIVRTGLDYGISAIPAITSASLVLVGMNVYSSFMAENVDVLLFWVFLSLGADGGSRRPHFRLAPSTREARRRGSLSTDMLPQPRGRESLE
tara:strand:- start:4974 stop:6302 length:1329 start_codon:yes stop_codon:yes gene_type:complete